MKNNFNEQYNQVTSTEIDQYHFKIQEKLFELGSLALCDSWASEEQLKTYLKAKLHHQTHVSVPDNVWHIDASKEEKSVMYANISFPVKDFIIDFLIDDSKTIFILPIMNHNHFHGLTIRKEHTADIENGNNLIITYLDPLSGAAKKALINNLDRDKEVKSNILNKVQVELDSIWRHINNELLSEVEVTSKGFYANNKATLKDFTELQLNKLKSIYPNNMPAINITDISCKQQIDGSDCGYIVSQTLYDLALDQELEIKSYSNTNKENHIQSIARIRAEFINSDIVGENKANSYILGNIAEQLYKNNRLTDFIKQYTDLKKLYNSGLGSYERCIEILSSSLNKDLTSSNSINPSLIDLYAKNISNKIVKLQTTEIDYNLHKFIQHFNSIYLYFLNLQHISQTNEEIDQEICYSSNKFDIVRNTAFTNENNLLKGNLSNTSNLLSIKPEFKEERFTESVIDSSALFEREELEISTVIEQAYSIGLYHYKQALNFADANNKVKLLTEEQKQDEKNSQQEYGVAAYTFAEVLKPALSKPEMLNLYVQIEDYKYIILNSIEHLGEIYLARTNTFNNYAKAAAIFQYAAAFAHEFNIEHSDILYINNFYDTNALYNKSLSQNACDTNKASASQNLFIPLYQYYIDKAYEVEQLFLNNSAHKNSESKSDTDQNKLKLYKQELAEFREIISESLKEFDKRPIEEVSIRAREVQDLYKAYSDFLVDKNKSNTDTNINGKNGINSSNTNDRDLANSGDISVNNTYGLLQRLITDCFNQLGPAPDECEYAVVGSGSLGGGRITPWSDLEFFILINKDKEEYKEYFREFTQLLHIKVINMGETPLRTAAIDELNNFKTGEAKDDWFWDEYIRKGFTFDAFHWDACKIPFGRQGGYKVKQKLKQEDGSYKEEFIQKEDFELILTPKKLAEFQHEILESEIVVNPNSGVNSDNINIYDSISNVKSGKNSIDNKNYNDSTTVTKVSWYKSDTHLVQALRMGGMLITGSQKLLDQYRQELRDENEVTKEIIKERILETLRKDLSSFSLKLEDEEEGKLIDIKKDIFRIADRVIDALALYFNVLTDEGEARVSAWELINHMHQHEHLSKDGAQHLKESLSIAAELRLATYLHNKGQRDSFSTYQPETGHLTERERKKLTGDTFYIKSTDILHHFYYVMVSIQKIAEKLCDTRPQKDAIKELESSILLDNSDYTKGLVHARFLEYENSIKYLDIATKNEPYSIRLLNSLCFLYYKTGNFEEALEVNKSVSTKYESDFNYPKIAISYNNLGWVYYEKGDYEQATKYYNNALDIMITADNKNYNPPAIASVINGLGATYHSRGDYDQAVRHYKDALKIRFIAYKESPNHPDIAMSHNNLGNVYFSKGDYEQAIEHFNRALKIMNIVYKERPNHPNIAVNYNNLGNAYSSKSDYEQAIKYYNHALKIRFIVYKENPNHPDIAASYSSLGSIYRTEGNFNQAIKYYNHALEIRLVVYKESPNHPDIAGSYNNLGNVYYDKGDYEQAIKYYNHALEIMIVTYKENPNHSGIAKSYNNLGIIYQEKGDYNQTIKFHNDALRIRLIVYKESPNHPDIAASYYNLGNVYYGKGDYEQAIKYYNHALEIKLIVYKESPNHPDIAKSYNNLGNVYYGKGDYEQAIKYYNHALEIRLIVYKESPNHPDIAASYNNLGAIYQGKGDYNQAIEYYNHALEIMIVAYKENLNHPDIAKSYNNLGAIYQDKGDYNQAIECLNHALEIRLIVYKENLNHPDIAKSYNNLGAIYQGKGDYNQAIEYYNHALEIMIAAYKENPNHPDITRSYNNLSNIYYNKGDYNQAIEYLNHALEIRLIVYKESPNHPDIAASYNNLGATHQGKGDYEQAIKYYNHALEIMIIAYKESPNHPNIAASYNNLGATHQDKGDHNQAIEYYNHALEIMIAAYKESPNHPDITRIYNNLGNVYYNKGDYNQAIEYYNHALEIMIIAYKESPNHPNIARSYYTLGKAYDNAGYCVKAIEHYNKALEIYEVAYKDELDHPDIIECFDDLALAYDNIENYDKDIEYYCKVLYIKQKGSGSDPNIAVCHFNLGAAYNENKDYYEAIEHFNFALAIMIDHEENVCNAELAFYHYNLGIVYSNLNMLDRAIEHYNKSLAVYKIVYHNEPNHPDIIECLDDLASTCDILKDCDENIKHYTEVLHLKLSSVNDVQNLDIAKCHDKLGKAYYKKGNFQKSVEHYNIAIAIKVLEHNLDPYSSDLASKLASSHYSLGKAYSKMRNYDKATKHFDESSTIYDNLETYSKDIEEDIIDMVCKESITYICNSEINDESETLGNLFKDPLI